MEKSSEITLKQCMGLKKEESILIIIDKNKRKIGQVLFDKAKEITDKVILVEIPVGKINGEEPPKIVADMMKKFDVILVPTTMSISHTDARRNASKAGARIATMPNISIDMFKRTLNVDYKKMKRESRRIASYMTKGNTMRIKTSKADLVMSLKGRKCKSDTGIYTTKGRFGNLPAGEAGMAPIEGTTNGIFVVDATMAGIGKLKKPIKFIVKKGYVLKTNSPKMNKIFKKYGKSSRNIAEVAIGTNEKAKITGLTLEDEKVKDTCHIAVGDSVSMGGKIKAPIHLDGVIKKPTIWIDDKKIMEKGKILIKL